MVVLEAPIDIHRLISIVISSYWLKVIQRFKYDLPEVKRSIITESGNLPYTILLFVFFFAGFSPQRAKGETPTLLTGATPAARRQRRHDNTPLPPIGFLQYLVAPGAELSGPQLQLVRIAFSWFYQLFLFFIKIFTDIKISTTRLTFVCLPIISN